MAETSGLWTTDAAPAGHQQVSYTQALASTLVEVGAACSGFEGVAPGYLSELAPSSTGVNNARIATGGAVVDGKYYKSTANEDHVIANAAAGETRIDRIVLRATWANFECIQTIIAGTSDPTPTAPAITQTTGVTYDIMICQVLVTDGGVITITDERTWAFADQAALTVLARAANSAGAPTLLTHASNGRVLMRTGNTLAFAQLEAGSFPNEIVTLAAMADNSVDDTKVGNRVPALTRRQGGSATIWNTFGVTDYTPTTVRMQTGCYRETDAGPSGNITITFPVAFSFVPIVFVEVALDTAATPQILTAVDRQLTSATQVVIDWMDYAAGAYDDIDFYWLAIGPE